MNVWGLICTSSNGKLPATLCYAIAQGQSPFTFPYKLHNFELVTKADYVTSPLGLEPWTSIFQFRRWKTEYAWQYILVYIIALNNQKNFSEINLQDSELMTYVNVSGRQLPKLLLHIQYYHCCLEIPTGIWIIAS